MSIRWVRVAAACAVAVASLMVQDREARACGGCFHEPTPPNPPPDQVTSVITDHRMVFSISTAQSVLWDQIRYSGNPVEFAWVLPVLPGARLELSRDAWIAALDASTVPVVTAPNVACGGGPVGEGSSGGCGGTTEAAAAAGGPDNAGATNTQVQVISQQVVGPYETVTLQSTNGNALNAWLTTNGYEVPPAVQPTIDAYVAQSFDFIALKLRPGQGVGAMQPVRVITPGADPTLPLRMVAAGAGANVGLMLFVVSEGRYHPQNFPDGQIDFSKLTWDAQQNQSNYEALAVAAMQTGNGTAWLTEYADQPQVYPSITPGSSLQLNASASNPGLADAYYSQCQPSPPNLGGCDAGGSSPDGGAEAAAACPPPPPTACASFDDLDVALTGLHAGSIWVTRLRAFFPVAALSGADLQLEATATQAVASNVHHTDTFSNPGYCGGSNGASPSGNGGGGGCACATARRARTVLARGLFLALAALGFLLVRRRAR